MAFSFANSSNTPASGAGGFTSFGSPATGTFGGGAFGSTAPAPATTGFGGFSSSFGSTAPAPAPFGYGMNSAAPSTGAFGFGASSNAGFGASSAPGGGSTGFSFGSPAPAPGGLFGSPGSTFGAAPATGYGAQPQQQLQQMMQPLSGSTPYTELPQEIKTAIDTIHELMMKHKRTMANLQTMAPRLLLKPMDSADMAAGSNSPSSQTSLSVTIRQLQQKISALESETVLQAQADHCKEQYETLLKQSVYYGKWQIENLAVRRGIHLRPAPDQQQQQQQPTSILGQSQNSSSLKDPKSVQAQLQAILDRQMAHVDRLERMPSPYLWQTLEDMENRLEACHHKVRMVQQQLLRSHRRSSEPEDITSIVQSQHQAICRVGERMARLHAQVDQLRQYYHLTEKGENVLLKAEYEEQERQRLLDERIKMQYVQATEKAVASAGQQPPAPAPGPFGSAPATSAFGGAAPLTGSSFGSTTPAPASSNLFSSTPAPSGGLFGSTPGAAPATATAPAASVFSPAPAAGAPGTGFFGSAPATAAAFGSFASSSASSTPKAKNKARSSRLRNK